MRREREGEWGIYRVYAWRKKKENDAFVQQVLSVRGILNKDAKKKGKKKAILAQAKLRKRPAGPLHVDQICSRFSSERGRQLGRPRGRVTAGATGAGRRDGTLHDRARGHK